MTNAMPQDTQMENLPVTLNREDFFCSIVRSLAVSLECASGMDGACSFVSMAGQNMGKWVNDEYKSALHTEQFDANTLAKVLVDLKRRIAGDFYPIEVSKDKIILGNHACPFGDKVLGNSSMCMMTSNVFGVISAESFGYSKVSLEKTIARGDPECRVVVFLKQSLEAEQHHGLEYHKS